MPLRCRQLKQKRERERREKVGCRKWAVAEQLSADVLVAVVVAVVEVSQLHLLLAYQVLLPL